MSSDDNDNMDHFFRTAVAKHFTPRLARLVYAIQAMHNRRLRARPALVTRACETCALNGEGRLYLTSYLVICSIQKGGEMPMEGQCR